MPSEAEYREQALFDERQAIKRERDELRAELAQERNERDATADMLREARAEVEHWRDACGVDHVQRVKALEAEVERLTVADRQWADHVKRLSEEVERLRALLQRIAEWDHLDSAADGPFWRGEIDKALARPKE